ncbi:hypothetical protein BH10ACI1_BH10ACI1_04500 [soil metagenome]
MKKLLLAMVIGLGFCACQTAQNTNVENKNTNTAYNQNRALENLRQQMKDQSSNSRKSLENIQNQIENGNPSSENVNNQLNNSREKLHDIEPETR